MARDRWPYHISSFYATSLVGRHFIKIPWDSPGGSRWRATRAQNDSLAGKFIEVRNNVTLTEIGRYVRVHSFGCNDGSALSRSHTSMFINGENSAYSTLVTQTASRIHRCLPEVPSDSDCIIM